MSRTSAPVRLERALGYGAPITVDPANKATEVCAHRIGGVHCSCWPARACCDCQQEGNA